MGFDRCKTKSTIWMLNNLTNLSLIKTANSQFISNYFYINWASFSFGPSFKFLLFVLSCGLFVPMEFHIHNELFLH